MKSNPRSTPRTLAMLALRFVLTIGIVNFFADLTYEGARSIAGPFLGSLGASAAVIGFVAGLGEMMGFGLRSVSGYLADKTRRYWTAAFIGYAVNMLAVPALALAGNWPAAAALMVAERTGRAIRRPAVESMLSNAGKSIGQGWVFGLNEALDQTGATLGPLLAAFVIYRHGGYRPAFATLLIPALLCLATVLVASILHPTPQQFEAEASRPLTAKGFSRIYWRYTAAGALIAAGFADFSLIAFHFEKSGNIAPNWIPLFYSVAMATSAIAAPVLGKLFDKMGLPVLLFAFGIPALFAPLVFLRAPALEMAGMVLWGIGIGAQDSCLKASLAHVIPANKRSTAFGVFDTVFGIAWFAGSAIMGLLYQISVPALVVFSTALELLALPVFGLAMKGRGGPTP